MRFGTTSIPSSVLALLVGATGLAFLETRDDGLLGMDSYPLILTSRVLSVADFLGNFSERLMDGYYPDGFYRPLSNFTFAFDYALWKLEPVGYQLSNALMFGAAGLALVLFLASRPVSRPQLAATIGLVFFLFHPFQFEVLPFPPRRPEYLCLIFVLLALASEFRPGTRFRVFSATCGLLAVSAKETGIVLPLLIFSQALVYQQGRIGSRVILACQRAALSALPMAIYLSARIAVLDGFGGRKPVEFGSLPEIFSQNLSTLLRAVTSPSASQSWHWFFVWSAMAAVWIVLKWSERALPAEDRRGAAGVGSDLIFTGCWWVVVTTVYSFSGRLSPWYVIFPIAGFAIAVASLSEGFQRFTQSSSKPRKATGTISLAVILLVCLNTQVRWSPLVRDYPIWNRAAAADRVVVRDLDALLDSSEKGTVVTLTAERKRIKGEGSIFQGVVLQNDYSLEALAALTHPELDVRVIKHLGRLKSDPLKPSEIVVLLERKKRQKGAAVPPQTLPPEKVAP